jgi:transposase InsO family protein
LAINRRLQSEVVLNRRGRRAAYQLQAPYLELRLTTPRHGDRPFHICHIDHTELDVEVVCSSTGRNLGRPWLTIFMDAFSRRFLAFFLSFDPPSYRSCMMVLRECVRRHGRLPQILVLDGGKEFDSVYFETLLARYECTKKTRPPAKPRFGSVCERLFGTSTQLIYSLAGNTQITKNVRQVTTSVACASGPTSFMRPRCTRPLANLPGIVSNSDWSALGIAITVTSRTTTNSA